jgi:N-methylhydantoinase A
MGATAPQDRTTGARAAGARLGVDVGGTFTDIVLQAGDGTLHLAKVSSTPHDPALAVVEGAVRLLRDVGVSPAEVGEIVHGTTVGSNTILQRTGARTGLLTTRGFRDVLEIGRIRTPRMFDLTWEKPEPLVPRRHRLEAVERLAADGSVVAPLDADSVRAAARQFRAEGIEAVAICFLHAHVNPAHEAEARAILEAEAPGLALTASSEVLQEMKEYERTSTTVVNAYLLLAMRRYLARLTGALAEEGFAAPVLVMSSVGGMMGAELAARKPVFVVGSGPAGGVAGAARLGRAGGADDAIVFDMGGTTAKASIVADGAPTLTTEYEFRDGISSSSRFIKGGGYMLKVPAIDIAEVGAGGGSIASLDPGGLLVVGPESAGAEPGPACYGLGNDRPTVTDANVVLGYFNPAGLVGGALPIDRARAVRAVEEHIARPLGLGVAEAAHGIRRVANVTMARALRAVTVERGLDPRGMALTAFGGSGPAHAVDLARLLGVRRVVVPALSGVFCSVGMLASDVEHSTVRPLLGRLDALEPARFDAARTALREEGMATLRREGFSGDAAELRVFAEMRYVGQSSELAVEVPDRPFADGLAGALAEGFHRVYAATYGYENDEPVELVALRLSALGRQSSRLDFAAMRMREAPPPTGGGTRAVSFARGEGPVETPVIARAEIGADWRDGPAIVEAYDTTVVVPPVARLRADGCGSLVIEPRDPAAWDAT